MKRALITAITGQDGAGLAEFLCIALNEGLKRTYNGYLAQS